MSTQIDNSEGMLGHSFFVCKIKPQSSMLILLDFEVLGDELFNLFWYALHWVCEILVTRIEKNFENSFKKLKEIKFNPSITQVRALKIHPSFDDHFYIALESYPRLNWRLILKNHKYVIFCQNMRRFFIDSFILYQRVKHFERQSCNYRK